MIPEQPHIRIELEGSQNPDSLLSVHDVSTVLVNATRIDILRILADKDCFVGELAQKLDLADSSVSHALKVLRELGLVRYTKIKTSHFYSLTEAVKVHHTRNLRILEIVCRDGRVLIDDSPS